ncbi:hypothetical protein BB561_002268 [Smittium simulii]|uniref:Macrophage erythroblast attacher n=1 Tax=Smittium simulii TaxID=133385 RepID=A0A2T9YR77_9FUNG|nr:hypothetical protein BB561_002268 [Smittium simulii]
MEKINPDNMLAIEQPLLKIVVEKLKKNVKSSQKLIEKDMLSAQNIIDSMLLQAENKPENDADITMEIDTDHQVQLLSLLKSLKAKLTEKKNEESFLVHQLSERAEHSQKVQTFSSFSNSEYIAWSKTRMNRLLLDFMIRMGYQESAKTLASRYDISDFADFDFFTRIISIEKSLLLQNNCSDCLKWCFENKTALKKLNISLEFELRLQEYIELCRANKVQSAIFYSKKHFKNMNSDQYTKYSQAMALLVFKPTTTCKRYQKLYNNNKWNYLANMFRSAAYSIFGLPSQPLLYPLIQTGISNLKTHLCTSSNFEDKNKNCPICSSQALKSISEDLPYSYHTNSHLVCRISGLKMNEDNPPMRLPNGCVYSYLALKDIAQQNDKLIVCPRTGESFAFSDCKKLFIV